MDLNEPRFRDGKYRDIFENIKNIENIRYFRFFWYFWYISDIFDIYPLFIFLLKYEINITKYLLLYYYKRKLQMQ